MSKGSNQVRWSSGVDWLQVTNISIYSLMYCQIISIVKELAVNIQISHGLSFLFC